MHIHTHTCMDVIKEAYNLKIYHTKNKENFLLKI